jgi:hypothetical protein|tara:strand:- start:1033 stop:1194 length:162 start_codon:yes stop_codon:yes gene_type:complete
MFHHIIFIFRRLQSFADFMKRQAELCHTAIYTPELNQIFDVTPADAQNVSENN